MKLLRELVARFASCGGCRGVQSGIVHVRAVGRINGEGSCRAEGIAAFEELNLVLVS